MKYKLNFFTFFVGKIQILAIFNDENCLKPVYLYLDLLQTSYIFVTLVLKIA